MAKSDQEENRGDLFALIGMFIASCLILLLIFYFL